MSNATLEKPTLESLAVEVRRLQERLEDITVLMELRAAVERNAGKTRHPLGTWSRPSWNWTDPLTSRTRIKGFSLVSE